MSLPPITSLCVAKFGGTSVADFEAMNRSASIVISNPAVRLVVLSASAGVTDHLVNLAEGNTLALQKFHLDEIRRIQYAIVDRLTEPTAIRKEINLMLNRISMLAKTAILSNSNELTDELVSYGELMSTLLFVEILSNCGVEAKWFDVRKVMRTNDNFGRAEPDDIILKEQVRSLLQPLLQQEIVITQGFIGMEINGRTTTLGRGGSDHTAALLGEALQAKSIHIWTDVSGIYTTDPHVVPEAKRIDKISFEEAAEMATFGAKILHPSAILPAVRSEIPVFIGSSKEPQAGGTLIDKHTNVNTPLFRALSLRKSQTLLALHSLNMLHTYGFFAEVFKILAHHAVSVDLITTSEFSIALTIDATGATTNGVNILTRGLLTDLSYLCQVKIEEDMALVALIGNRLPYACGVGKKVFCVLDSFHIRLICYGASNHNLCLVVNGSDAEEIVQILHNHLFV